MRQELSDIIAFLEETPEAVRQLRVGLEAGELRGKADNGEFSFVEHVCHLRDIERDGYGPRIEKLLREERPILRNIDGAKLALERQYNEQRFDDGLAGFSQARSHNVSVLRGVSDEQLDRGGEFEGVGQVTLERLVSMMYEHDQSHREELRSLRVQLLGRRSAA
jgi:hypothetical protein